jgi:hypothetical protein
MEAHHYSLYYPRIPHLPRQALREIRLRLRARTPPVAPHRRRRDRELHHGHAVLELRSEYFAGHHGGLYEEDGGVLPEGGGGDGLRGERPMGVRRQDVDVDGVGVCALTSPLPLQSGLRARSCGRAYVGIGRRRPALLTTRTPLQSNGL